MNFFRRSIKKISGLLPKNIQERNDSEFLARRVGSFLTVKDKSNLATTSRLLSYDFQPMLRRDKLRLFLQVLDTNVQYRDTYSVFQAEAAVGGAGGAGAVGGAGGAGAVGGAGGAGGGGAGGGGAGGGGPAYVTTTVRQIMKKIMRKSFNVSIFEDWWFEIDKSYDSRSFEVHSHASKTQDRDAITFIFRVLKHFDLFDTRRYPVSFTQALPYSFNPIASAYDKSPYQRKLDILIDLIFTTPTPPPSPAAPLVIEEDDDDEDEDEDEEDEDEDEDEDDD
jgi:hypothetical protein